jgi:hypothetical protein
MRATCVFILLCAIPSSSLAQNIILRGTIVSPEDVIRDGSVAINGSTIVRVDARPCGSAPGGGAPGQNN